MLLSNNVGKKKVKHKKSEQWFWTVERQSNLKLSLSPFFQLFPDHLFIVMHIYILCGNKSKVDFFKNKLLVHKMKRQPLEGEKISDKGLIYKIYKELIQLNSSKTNNLIKNWQRTWIDISLKKNIWLYNEYMKRCLLSLIIKAMQVKTTVRYHLIPIRMATILKREEQVLVRM